MDIVIIGNKFFYLKNNLLPIETKIVITNLISLKNQIEHTKKYQIEQIDWENFGNKLCFM